jgi:ATP-dependent exoDNAse (exonuclease V) alpha subunit
LQNRHVQDVKPFTIFLTGGAGTGKSHLIKHIHYEFDKILTAQKENPDSPIVLLVAYTGTAAYNIGGQTIHSALGINKSMGKSLVEEQANTLRCKLQNLQLLIIDEVSMVSTPMLNLIHSRLQQIKQPSSQSAVFGNINILAVGDFYQVPPVAAKPLTSNYASLTDLWSNICIWELNEVVRQKGDHQFASLLNRLRTRKRDDPISDADNSLLESEKIGHKNTVLDIEAADIVSDINKQKTYKRREPLLQENTNLPSYLRLCVDARVMLTANIDVQDGLTNGAMGTVTGIINGRKPLGQPEAMCVLFDDVKIGDLSSEKM